MNKLDLCKITFKFFGVASILKALDSTRNFIIIPFSFTNESEKLMFIHMVITSIVPFILLLSAGIVLWLRSDYFAKLLMNDIESTEKSEISIENIQMIVFSSIGLFILVTTIPDLVQVLSKSIIIHKQWFLPAYDSDIQLTEIPRVVVKLILGIYLFLGSRGIGALLNTLRDAGVRKKL